MFKWFVLCLMVVGVENNFSFAISRNELLGSIYGVQISEDKSRLVAQKNSGTEIDDSSAYPYRVTSRGENQIVQIGGSLNKKVDMGVTFARREGEGHAYEYSRYYIKGNDVLSVSHCLKNRVSYSFGLAGRTMESDKGYTCYAISSHVCGHVKNMMSKLKIDPKKCQSMLSGLQKVFSKDVSGGFGSRYSRQLNKAKSRIATFASGHVSENGDFIAFTEDLKPGSERFDNAFGLMEDLTTIAQLCNRFQKSELGVASGSSRRGSSAKGSK